MPSNDAHLLSRLHKRTRGLFQWVVKYLTYPLVFVILVWITLYHLHVIGLPSREYQMGIVIAILAVILERLVALESRVSEPPFKTFPACLDAYNALSAIVAERGNVSKVDLIQFSGNTVLGLLRTIAMTSPRVQIRLLLQHPMALF